MRPSLAVGDFARASHLSVKALRHYHQVGLLVPTAIDPSSRYRRYTTDQIPTAQVIRRFGDLDMPLEQIRAVLAAPDPATRSEVLAAHLDRLEHGLARTQAAVAALRGLLASPPPAALIAHRSEGALAAAVIRADVAHEDLEPWFQGAIGELLATVRAQGAAAAGPPGSIVAGAFFTDEQGEVTVFVPTGSAVRPVGRVEARLLPPVELATIVHAGPHDDIDRAYGALATYVAERAVGVEGPIRERYLVGRHDTGDPAAWRTEIGWPIFDIGPTGSSEGM